MAVDLVAVDLVLQLLPAVDLVAVDLVLQLLPAVDLVAVDLVAVDLVPGGRIRPARPGPRRVGRGPRRTVRGPRSARPGA